MLDKIVTFILKIAPIIIIAAMIIIIVQVGRTWDNLMNTFDGHTKSLNELEIQINDNDRRIQELRDELAHSQQLLDELKARLKDIEIRLDKLLETFDLAEEYTVTAYAPLDENAIEGLDYWGDPNVTASGEPPIPNETVAAGRHIPFGTKIWIEGIGIRIVNDRGGAIGRKNIDLCVDSVDNAKQFGRRKLKVLILGGV